MIGAAALSTLRVVEVAQGVAGPFCGKTLADLGADVIKLEFPEGDSSRRVGPFPADRLDPEKSGQFLYNNANKRGACIDFEDSREHEHFLELLGTADVLVIDQPPRWLEAHGLAYESLSRVHPGLIMTCISPFGQDGPYRDYRATELTSFHVGGLGHETPHNQVTDPEQQPPLVGGGFQAGYLTGWTAATATLVALRQRHISGRGQRVDIAEMECVANMLRYSIAAASHDPEHMAPRVKTGYPWILPCKDGHVSFSPFQFDHWWSAFQDMMGQPDWASVELFSTLAGRLEHADLIERLTVEWMMQHTKQEIYAMALERGLPGFPVHTMAEVIGSPQFAARDFFVELEHPQIAGILQPGAPCRYERTPWKIRKGAPRLGEDDMEVWGLHPTDSADHRHAVQWRERERLPRGPEPPESDPLQPPPNQPLAGIRIAEFGWVLAVPHATAWLAVLGAEVIRVESRRRLDLVRLSPAGAADGIPGVNRSGFFNGLNYAKKSLTIDLSRPEGVEMASRLVARSDIVTENFSVGVMEKLGLGPQVIRSLRPDVILLRASPLGATGPERFATGWGPNTQAYAGLPFLTGYEDGPPSGLGGNWPDYMIGVSLAFALLAALHHRDRTGEGQILDVSMAETVATMIPEAILEYGFRGQEPRRHGNAHPSMVPHGVYPCRGDDQWVALAVEDDSQWRSFREAIGHPPWAADRALEKTAHRLARRVEIDAHVSEWTRDHTHYQVMHKLQAVGIAAAPCLDTLGLMADPQTAARRFVVELDHPEVGRRTVAGLPGRYSAMPVLDYRRAPLLGEHNEEILCGLLGLPRERFEQLCEEQVVF